MDEATLIEKLRRIEALHAGAATPGERTAAAGARERLLERLRRFERAAPAVEYKFTFPDAWNRRVMVALLRRYGIEPYRYPRQRHTTVMAKVPHSFVRDTLQPEFREISASLMAYLDSVTERVIRTAIHKDGSEVTIVPEQIQS
ncbi:hypothetical protein ABI59_15190 [Acidobacteria bacterium Mor1]|nr:hypothetical protein ABI59_15190 [Acidobacteria bacterium Mor1]